MHSALIVDDDPFSRQVISCLLDSIGMTVQEAVHAQEALEILRHTAIDLIFIDIQLEDSCGDELCKVIRADLPEKNYGSIVAITGGSELPGESPELADCFDAILYKPFDRAKLLRLIEQLEGKLNVDSHPGLHLSGLKDEAILCLLGGEFNPDEGVQFFSQYFQTFVMGFDQSFTQGDIAKCQQLAHKIKGAMSFIGAEAVSAKAKSLELACVKRSKSPEIRDLYEQIVELVDILMQDIRQFYHKG